MAKKFVITHLDADVDEENEASDDKTSPKALPSESRTDLAELDSCIDLLGGRLTDLEFLARRIKGGETPTKAVGEIVEQSASEILKMYVFNSDEGESSKRWTSEQAWLLIKELSEKGSLRFNEIILSDTFKAGGENVLRALEQAELISIVSGPNGRPASIKPGKPVYHPAFKRLTEDNVLRSRLDLAILTDLTKIENATIEKVENELLLLSQLGTEPKRLVPRIQYLVAKLASSQDKVERYETESKALKKVLGEEY